ncbi:hypothetical protein HELRODRAFT_178191 [Helobdella robusta]|uniref:Uncharacterized protein n=1 Tax=Helobdella robusta TaxID=6412 RepID=T1FCX0_HELRO|nr:hypothetical protein HELRODRAFT_178191 [Helobdella robusta]ESN97400.1 hypothetical protein HELRODRAFT_178191 [Helobdella robusta]
MHLLSSTVEEEVYQVLNTINSLKSNPILNGHPPPVSKIEASLPSKTRTILSQLCCGTLPTSTVTLVLYNYAIPDQCNLCLSPHHTTQHLFNNSYNMTERQVYEKKLAKSVLDDSSLVYYCRVFQTLDEVCDNNEEKNTLISNALDQLKENALLVSQNNIGSKLIEKLLTHANIDQFVGIARCMSNNWECHKNHLKLSAIGYTYTLCMQAQAPHHYGLGRYNGKFKLLKSRTVTNDRHWAVCGIKLMNELPLDEVNITNISPEPEIFKSRGRSPINFHPTPTPKRIHTQEEKDYAYELSHASGVFGISAKLLQVIRLAVVLWLYKQIIIFCIVQLVSIKVPSILWGLKFIRCKNLTPLLNHQEHYFRNFTQLGCPSKGI